MQKKGKAKQKILFIMYFIIYGIVFTYIYSCDFIYKHVDGFIKNSGVPFIFFFGGLRRLAEEVIICC